MRLGTIDDHAGVRCIAHLLERERAADHVAGEPLPASGIVGADPVMDREARVTPVEHALCEPSIQHALGAKEIEQLVAQGFAEKSFGQWWQCPEGAGGQDHAVGDQSMDMRVDGHEIAEGLHVEDESGLTMWLHGVEADLEESCDQSAKLTKITATKQGLY